MVVGFRSLMFLTLAVYLGALLLLQRARVKGGRSGLISGDGRPASSRAGRAASVSGTSTASDTSAPGHSRRER